MCKIAIGIVLIALPAHGTSLDSIALNTSNAYKLAEFQNLFGEYGVDVAATHYDLHEIDADPVSVVAYKASQVAEGVIVDDTSLEVEGVEIGVKIRWLQHLLSNCIGKRASWRVLLAKREKDEILVYEGCVRGRIVAPRVEGGYSFDPYLLPDGKDKTLAEDRPRDVSARARAVDKLIRNEPDHKVPVIFDWQGPWQPDVHEVVAG